MAGVLRQDLHTCSHQQKKAIRYAQTGIPAEPEELRHLDHRARTVLRLFAKADIIIAADVATALGLSVRMARLLLKGWVKDGWLIVENPSNRKRSYKLSAIYQQFIGNASAWIKMNPIFSFPIPV